MVDSQPPPDLPPPAPPEDPGPDVNSDEWHKVEETRSKRKAFGAGIGFLTGEKIRKFTFEMVVKTQLEEDDDVPNLYALHRAFVERLIAVTEGDTHLMPTAKDSKSSEKQFTRNPIVSVDGFPTTDRSHRNFFRRQIVKTYTNKTRILLHHEVLMKETVFQAKAKLLEWLQEKNLWMKHGDLDSVETSGIGWMLGAHAVLVFKPAVAERLNHLIANLPKDILEAQLRRLGNADDLSEIPPLFVNSRKQGFGAPPGRVETQAVTLSCVNNRVRLMKELISLIPKEDMPYTFIPMGLATMESPELYMKFMIINNDRQNELQGIAVKSFSKELLTRLVSRTDKQCPTVEEHLTNHPMIVSVQETHQSQEFGKYMVIVYKEGFQDARAMLNDFSPPCCSTELCFPATSS